MQPHTLLISAGSNIDSQLGIHSDALGINLFIQESHLHFLKEPMVSGFGGVEIQTTLPTSPLT